MRQLLRFTALLTLLTFITACGGLSSEPATYTSTDGNVTVDCPAGWGQFDLHDDGDIEVANPSNECYFLLLSESRADYTGTLLEHTNDTRPMFLMGATGVSEEGPNELTIDGHPALQYIINATVERINITYIHTTVQTPESYHQTLAWTLRSNFAANEAELQSVIHSLKDSAAGPGGGDEEVAEG